MRRSDTSFSFLPALVSVAFLIVLAGSVPAANNCAFTTHSREMTLTANCTTDATIFIPNGFTMDLNGKTITGVDPVGGHFLGAVVRAGGAAAAIENGTITVSGLTDFCDSGDNELRGVLFAGASGSISSLHVIDINQGPSMCQEGNAIEVRNFGDSAATSRVTIDSNTISGYQKTGIVANGNADVTVTDNTVTGSGPIATNAANGIQVAYGATGMVKRNTVSDNSYSGPDNVSVGILLVGVKDFGDPFCVGVQIMQNTLRNNDVGVYLYQAELDGSPAATATNAKVTNNTISSDGVHNGIPYQAGIVDTGNNDKIISNSISGPGYDPDTVPGSTFAIDVSNTSRAHVHANR
jgi:parallel beta-helix repeat protein